ncbi:MAG: hypothetical protein IJQ95_00480 [Paludibacteraceae bacterium]|nr:hypothetical protein [Paludibacteraceae bacterium]
MKTKIVFLSILLLGLVSCTTSDLLDTSSSNKPSLKNVALPPSFQFTMSHEIQDEIAYYIANACTDQAFMSGLQNYVDTISSSPYFDVVFSADTDDALTEQGRLLMEDSHELAELICGVCADNYLRLNLYIPNSSEILQSYDGVDDIYIVNALYREALDIVDDSADIYTTAYVISNGTVNEQHIPIDEDFANQHLTIVLSFRDEIVNWHHFSKGNQSYSDLLLRYAISFVGFSSTNAEDIESELHQYYNCGVGIRFSIEYGKRLPHRQCDDRYNKFCRLKVIRNIDNIQWTQYEEWDPYHTAWIFVDYENSLHKVYVNDNPWYLDLRGYDFYIQEQFIYDETLTLYIPQQICTYSEEDNALCFQMICQGY